MLSLQIPPSHNNGFDFDFNDARPLPFLSAPSTPKPFGDLSLSAPTSPSRLREFYNYFDDAEVGGPDSNKGDDFAFDVSSDLLGKESLSAEELFDGGKIKPTTKVNQINQDFTTSPVALSSERYSNNERGRERSVSTKRMNSSRNRSARSLSPLRVAAYPWEEEQQQQQQQEQQPHQPQQPTQSKSSSRKWRLKDLLLFRSASEGRASDRDPLRKYTALFKKQEVNDKASSSMRHSGSGLRRNGHVSAHELHYTKNKAASQDLKKKTFLPYKQGILGRFAFHPSR